MWSNDGKIPWQAVAIGVSLVFALFSAAGTWFVNSYRLDQVETQIRELNTKFEGRIDKIEERQVRLQATYEVLIDQARDHGWTIPWQGRRR